MRKLKFEFVEISLFFIPDKEIGQVYLIFKEDYDKYTMEESPILDGNGQIARFTLDMQHLLEVENLIEISKDNNNEFATITYEFPELEIEVCFFIDELELYLKNLYEDLKLS